MKQLAIDRGERVRRGSQRMPSAIVALRRAGIVGGFLIGLSTFQAEFDFGVPQFRLVFQPFLIALAAGVALVAGRLWIGPGGAIAAAVFFLGLRGIISLIVGPVLGETTPSLPLYLGSALLVELVALALVKRRSRSAWPAARSSAPPASPPSTRGASSSCGCRGRPTCCPRASSSRWRPASRAAWSARCWRPGCAPSCRARRSPAARWCCRACWWRSASRLACRPRSRPTCARRSS
jgi:hypothetical protein